MKFNIDNEEYIDLEDVLKITGMKQTMLYEKMRYNLFPKQHVTNKKLWKKSEIEEYINKNGKNERKRKKKSI